MDNKQQAIETFKKFHRDIRLLVEKLSEVEALMNDIEPRLEAVEDCVANGAPLHTEQMCTLVEDSRHDWNVCCTTFHKAMRFAEGVDLGLDAVEWTEV